MFRGWHYCLLLLVQMVAIYGLGEILWGQRQLTATTEVEAVDTGAQMRAVGFGT